MPEKAIIFGKNFPMPLFRFFVVVLAATLISCKTEKKNETSPETELTILEKLAQAHGYEYWGAVERINFTFNVDRDSTHFERSWSWKPMTDDVVSISGSDTLVYNRKNMDSIAYKANAGFINDRYWLLAPFNLIWDSENFEYEHTFEAMAPLRGTPMQKLTVTYGSEGGYTPGDAYDFYFDDDFLIKEWVFRKGNQEEPSMITTWENYTQENELKLALVHKKPDENFTLYFTNVEVKLDE